jgi:hypothetical protein
MSNADSFTRSISPSPRATCVSHLYGLATEHWYPQASDAGWTFAINFASTLDSSLPM